MNLQSDGASKTSGSPMGRVLDLGHGAWQMTASVIIQRAILGLIATAAIVYAGDYLWAKHLMSEGNSAALGSVMVHSETDIPRKDGRVEIDIDAPEAESCIHSMFPHFGYVACWYAVRHTTIRN